MTKIIAIPNAINDIELIIDNCDAIILGIKDLSVNFNEYISIEELNKHITEIKANNKQIFISLNKIMHNDDLKILEQSLTELNKLDIDGILYYDISIITISKRLKLNTKLIWNQTHLVTNYQTINYWYNEGIDYAYISPEITLNEIIDIKKNTKMALMVPIFGYLPMMHSKRKLVTNYLTYINQNIKNNNYTLYEESRKSYYPITEDDNGTTIYSSNILNGLEEYISLLDNNIEYVILNGININVDDFLEVIKIFFSTTSKYQNNKVDMAYVMMASNEIDMLLKNTDKGFLYKETIYKVKNDEE